MTVPKAPAGAGPDGRRLWRSIMAEFELSEHETAILRQAVHVADLCAELQSVVDREGVLIDGPSGPRAHPGAVELRQQRILLTRLVVALRVPLGDQEQPSSKTSPTPRRTQHRGTRGAYGLRSVPGGVA